MLLDINQDCHVFGCLRPYEQKEETTTQSCVSGLVCMAISAVSDRNEYTGCEVQPLRPHETLFVLGFAIS